MRNKNIGDAVRRSNELKRVLRALGDFDYVPIPGSYKFPCKLITYPVLEYDLPTNAPTFEANIDLKILVSSIKKQGLEIFYVTDLDQYKQFIKWAENRLQLTGK